MKRKDNKINTPQVKILQELGRQIREYRKRLKISAMATAEAADISRITLYRIELGEVSVAIGAYINVIHALGLKLELSEITNTKKLSEKKSTVTLPQKIKLADFKQLKKLAWQLKGIKELKAEDALSLYERNWRHIDLKNLDKNEEKLIQTLMAAFGRRRLLV